MPSYRIISADSHVFEPPDLWTTRLDKPFRERAPRPVPNYQGQEGTFFVAEGIAPRRIASIAALDKKPEELPSFNKAGYQDLRPGGWDPAARLQDQELDGVEAEVIYATFAMYLFGMPDAVLQEACFRAYNDWLAEYCRYAPARLVGLGLISLYDVSHAVAELQRCAKQGLRGAMISVVPPHGVELSDPQFDPFWRAAEELDMPISLHILTSSRQGPLRFNPAVFGAGYYMTIPHEIQLTLADLICHGVLERHPRLRLVSAEGDIGWIAHFLARLDHGHARFAHLNNIYLEMPPSEYFRRQVFATFIDDRVGVATREFVGVDNLMWSSDYPHTDSSWPRSRQVIEKDFAGVSEAETAKIVGLNASKLYRLDGA